jgi:hypothetical protein
MTIETWIVIGSLVAFFAALAASIWYSHNLHQPTATKPDPTAKLRDERDEALEGEADVSSAAGRLAQQLTETRATLARVQEDRSAAWREAAEVPGLRKEVAQLKARLVATEKQLDASMGYTPENEAEFRRQRAL